jgi:hypothetical protein
MSSNLPQESRSRREHIGADILQAEIQEERTSSPVAGLQRPINISAVHGISASKPNAPPKSPRSMGLSITPRAVSPRGSSSGIVGTTPAPGTAPVSSSSPPKSPSRSPAPSPRGSSDPKCKTIVCVSLNDSAHSSSQRRKREACCQSC